MNADGWVGSFQIKRGRPRLGESDQIEILRNRQQATGNRRPAISES
jgi:hypothetical protein